MATPASPAVPATDLLTKHGLQGLSAVQIIDRLDRTQDDRQAGLAGSVRVDELLLSDNAGNVTLPIPADRFYLSLAPYLSKTHDCFFHNLMTCQGELAQTTVHVTIKDSSGKTLVDEDATTYANGFVGYWLPRDITGTLEVSYQSKKSVQPISTGKQAPTCLTTVKLV